MRGRLRWCEPLEALGEQHPKSLARARGQTSEKSLEIGVPAELTRVLSHRAHLPVESARDVDHMIEVVAHDEEDLADAVRSEPCGALGRIVERARCAEVACVDHGGAYDAVIRVKLRDAIPRRARERIMRHDDFRALLADQPGRRLDERRARP